MGRDRYRYWALKDDPPETCLKWQMAYRGYLRLMRLVRWRAAEIIARDADAAAKGRK